MIRVLGIGDNVGDKYLHTETVYPGGNALNIAVFSSFLGMEAGYLGVFGDDEVGKHVHDVIEEIGIDISHCRYEHGENGLARVQLVDGDRVFLQSNRGGISRVKPPVLSDEDMSYIRSFDLLHTSCYSSMEAEMDKLGRSGPFVSFDFSGESEEDYIRSICPNIDAATLSCSGLSDEEVLDRIETVRSYGCRHIVNVTRGSKGAVVSVDGVIYKQSPLLVDALDTLGAGDSFLCCFLVNYLDGMKMAEDDFPMLPQMNGITTRAGYKDAVIRTALYKAAVFSSRQCNVHGSFGHGRHMPLTDIDRSYMK